MNLHALVSPYVGAINPNFPVTVTPSAGGYTIGPDGSRVPSYGAPYTLTGQIQSLTYTDILQIGGLNLTGHRRAIYLSGDVESISRIQQKGGDLISFPDGTIWLVAMLLEDWNMMDGWVKVAVTQQV